MKLKVNSSLGDCLFELEQTTNDGKIKIISAKQNLLPAINRWLTSGFTELDCATGHTDPSDPQFLFNLKRYLERQFDFSYELHT